jgi:hypothetical protein
MQMIADASCITFAVANVLKQFFPRKALSPWDVYSPQLTEANFASGEISPTMQLQSSEKNAPKHWQP